MRYFEAFSVHSFASLHAKAYVILSFSVYFFLKYSLMQLFMFLCIEEYCGRKFTFPNKLK